MPGSGGLYQSTKPLANFWLIKILVTSGLNYLQWGQDANKSSPLHLTIKSVSKGKFLMGNFSSDNGYPGVPLAPRVFEQAENGEANWLEIEFQTSKGSSPMTHRYSIVSKNRCIDKLLTCPCTGLRDCYNLCAQVLNQVNS